MHASNTPTATKKKKTAIPITLFNTQNRHRLPIRKLEKQAVIALTLLSKSWPKHVPEVTVIFVSKQKIARIHRDFLQDPTATDVITFEHGEIYICPAIADIQRKASGTSLHDEILTYLIHGLLHLCGWNDLSPSEFNAMAKKQSTILQKVLMLS